MTTVPDIQIIERLLADLPQREANRPVASNCADLLAEYMEINRDEAWWEFLSLVANLQALAMEIPSRGARRAIDGAVVALLHIFAPDMLVQRTNVWADQTAAQRAVVENALALFDDLQFDRAIALTKAPDLLAEIEKLSASIATNESISDAVKEVLRGQLHLLVKSVDHLRSRGVGPFRASVFTVFGRIYVEMRDAPNKAEAAALRAVLDDLGRAMTVFEAAGTLARLAPPAVALLIAAS